MNTCDQCGYFVLINPEGGQCRYEPPKVFVIPTPSLSGEVQMQPISVFPAVRWSEFCGRHTAGLKYPVAARLD